ncbi:S-adenosyl-L-methionine-dependent methyltransferase [Whalleya microplaca]|nr:S-adenosyl-L-methionine-dependent methyltransferase [Whalleya microplaca]
MTAPSGSSSTSGAPGKPPPAGGAGAGADVGAARRSVVVEGGAPSSSLSADCDSALSASACADDEGDTYDSFSGRFSADSTSVCASARDYVYENQRRYHKYDEGLYHFPNDDAEQEREDLQHAMFLHLCDGKLHFAPIRNPQSILDIGTGTGIWAIEMGDEYPGAEVLGIDLSPIQPIWVPRNVQFLIDNIEEDWLQPADSLDYIHARQMSTTIRDWPKLFAEAYKTLRPGGWIELQDLKAACNCDDGTMLEGDMYALYTETFTRAMNSLGVDPGSVYKYAEWLREAGFVNIEVKMLKTPVGTWPEDPHQSKIGLFNRNMIYDGLHGFSIKPFTRGLGWTVEEVEVFLVDVRKALLNSTAHIWLPFLVVYGQKPLNPDFAR